MGYREMQKGQGNDLHEYKLRELCKIIPEYVENLILLNRVLNKCYAPSEVKVINSKDGFSY